MENSHGKSVENIEKWSVYPRVTNFTYIYLLLDQDFQPGPVKSIRSMLRRPLEVASWNKTVGLPWELKGIDGM